jgi:hypothetical protein
VSYQFRFASYTGYRPWSRHRYHSVISYVKPQLSGLLSIFCRHPLWNLYFAATDAPQIYDYKQFAYKIPPRGEGGGVKDVPELALKRCLAFFLIGSNGMLSESGGMGQRG